MQNREAKERFGARMEELSDFIEMQVAHTKPDGIAQTRNFFSARCELQFLSPSACTVFSLLLFCLKIFLRPLKM